MRNWFSDRNLWRICCILQFQCLWSAKSKYVYEILTFATHDDGSLCSPSWWVALKNSSLMITASNIWIVETLYCDGAFAESLRRRGGTLALSSEPTANLPPATALRSLANTFLKGCCSVWVNTVSSFSPGFWTNIFRNQMRFGHDIAGLCKPQNPFSKELCRRRD